MRNSRSSKLSFLVAIASAALALPGCGSNHEALVSVSVSPTAASATHGAATDTVQFAATGNLGTYGSYRNSTATAVCKLHAADTTGPLTQITWTTSDSANATIDASGRATCVGPTAQPATITATASGTCGVVSGTATLNCN